jgi:hypothetical protein
MDTPFSSQPRPPLSDIVINASPGVEDAQKWANLGSTNVVFGQAFVAALIERDN